MKIFSKMLIVGAAFLPWNVSAQELFTFSNGEVADANQINQNFTTLEEALNDLQNDLASGIDGADQVHRIDCNENAEALEDLLSKVSFNAAHNILVSGGCEVTSIYASAGTSLAIYGSDPNTDSIIAAPNITGGQERYSWSPVFADAGSSITLFNISIRQHPRNRYGAYAWQGGHLTLGNVVIDAKFEEGAIQNAFYCVGAELGSVLYLSGLDCTNTVSGGVQLNGGASGWFRGSIKLESATGALRVRGGSTVVTDRARFQLVGQQAIHIWDNSSFRQQYGDETTSYEIDGDVLIESGSGFHLLDSASSAYRHLRGEIRAIDSSVTVQSIDSNRIVLTRSSGVIAPVNPKAEIVADDSRLELIPPDNPELQVKLKNSTVKYRGDVSEPSTFSCRGYSNVEDSSGNLSVVSAEQCWMPP